MRVVITGASAGIGRATAIEFARWGARVALLARGADGLEGARRDVEAAGGTPLVIPCDVADCAQVEAAAAQVEQAWGGIDIWVNNAMATIFSPIMDIPSEDFRRVTDVTYLGAVWGTRAALARMLPAGGGTIVQVGSALAYRSIPLQSAYCGAKALRSGASPTRSGASCVTRAVMSTSRWSSSPRRHRLRRADRRRLGREPVTRSAAPWGRWGAGTER